MNVSDLIELLSDLPDNLPVLVKDKGKEKLVEVRGVLYAERMRDGELAAVLRFDDDWTQYWWRGVSTPDDEWGPRRKPPMREPLRLSSRLTSKALANLGSEDAA